MKLYMISVRIGHPLLKSDTLHMFVLANSWEDFASRANLEMWVPEDEDNVERWISDAKQGKWCFIKGHEGDSAMFRERKASQKFIQQLEKMEATIEFGGHPTSRSLHSF